MSLITNDIDAIIIINPNENEHPQDASIMDIIKEKQNDQDFNQRIGVASTLVLEIYRVLMGAFLVLFVPQKCGSGICSLSQNMNRDNTFSRLVLGFNSFTMLAFLGLYLIEVKRTA